MAKREEIYILNEGGETLFYYSTIEGESSDVDKKQFLTASYLTAVLQFTKAAAKGNIIRHFEMGKVYVGLKTGNKLPLTYVYVAEKKRMVNEKRLDKILDQVIEGFESKFDLEKIRSWDGDTEAFDEYKGEIKRILRNFLTGLF
jgi:hypothetical protein